MIIKNTEITKGVFVKELKNRFLCQVLINDKCRECYVPSSCHLSNFVDLSNVEVILVKNTPGSRTDYSLLAFIYLGKYVLLNTTIVNKIVYEKLNSKKFNFLGKRKKIHKEYKIEDYKSDFFIEDTNSFIEVKSLLTVNKIGEFPTVYSERTINQLTQFIDFLKKGYRVYLFIVSLNPTTKTIHINEKSDFYFLLKHCINLGLILKGYSLELKDDFSIEIYNCKVIY